MYNSIFEKIWGEIMIVDVSKKILIVGLGLLGGSYAKVLKRFGDTGEAYECFMSKSQQCVPLLDKSELKKALNILAKALESYPGRVK